MDLRNRLNSKGQREGKVIDYRYTTSIITHNVNKEKDAYWKNMLLRWFGHVQRRPPNAPVRSGVLERVGNVKRGRGRPKLTWDESVKRYLKDWNISKEIALDRSIWKLAINVLEP